MPTIRSNVLIDRPPADVFAALVDADRFTDWKDGLIAVSDVTGDLGRVGGRYVARLHTAGRDVIGTYEITEADPPWRLVQVGRSAGVRTTSTNVLTATPTGTDLAFSLEYTMPLGPVGAILDRLLLRGRIARTLERSHDRLRDLLEAT